MAEDTPQNDRASQLPGGSAKASSVPGKGFRIGEYVIEKSIGHGSMATVYLAHDSTGHEVALKIFQEGPGVSATMLERFRREAEASKKLRRHPNIMKVYATGQEGPYHYIVMEPVRNSRTLDDIIESSMLTTNQIVDIIIKIASALHYAHTRNIVHRDVKPTNVMVDEFGEPLLTDFGVAALIDWPSCTITGALTGTPLYMSPEQARSERVGPESDIYSLGVVLYEALTEVLPYSAQHSSPVKKVLEAVKEEQPKRPRAHNKEISPDLEAVIMKALEKDPDDRYPDVQAFAHDLENAMAGRHVTAQLFSFRERIYFVCRKYEKAIAITLIFLAIVVGIAAHFHQQLISARYDTLISKASYRNIEARSSSNQQANEQVVSQQPGSWPEIRMARRAMNRGAWNSARTHLEAAIYLSQQIGDTRTLATATLDLARIKSINGSYELAVSDYMNILNNPDASPPVLNYAMIEALILTLLNDQRNDALQLLTHHNMPSDNIFKNAILCLSGDMSMERYLEQITYLPRRLQNDAHLAAAIRYKMDGNDKGYALQLKRTIQSSMPASEWPAPLAKRLYEETRK